MIRASAPNNVQSSGRLGFTLIELLMVMGILSILAGLAIAAFGTAVNSARETQTRTVIGILDGVIREREAFYEQRVLDSDVGAFRYFRTPDRQVEFTTRFEEGAGSALSASSGNYFVRRKLFASVFPQTFRDLCGFDGRPGIPEGITGSDDDGDGNIDFVGSSTVDLLELGLGGSATDDPPVSSVIRRAVVALGATVDLTLHTPSTESAEVLYLCMTNEIVPGIPTLSSDDIPGNFVLDSDGDGLLELVDGWERPLRFYTFNPGLFRPTPWTWDTTTVKPDITADQTALASVLAGGAITISPGVVSASDRTNALNRDLVDRFDSVRAFNDNSPPLPVLASVFEYDLDGVSGGADVSDAPGLPVTFGTPSFPMIVSAGPDEVLGLGEPTAADGTQFATVTVESDAYDNLTSLQQRRR